MTQADFLDRLKALHDDCVEISRKKNADYASNNDAFLNFRGASVVGLTPEEGILVRLTDKLTRVSNLLRREAQVKDESIIDSCKDAANYFLILAAFIEDKNGGLQNPEQP